MQASSIDNGRSPLRSPAGTYRVYLYWRNKYSRDGTCCVSGDSQHITGPRTFRNGSGRYKLLLLLYMNRSDGHLWICLLLSQLLGYILPPLRYFFLKSFFLNYGTVLTLLPSQRLKLEDILDFRQTRISRFNSYFQWIIALEPSFKCAFCRILLSKLPKTVN